MKMTRSTRLRRLESTGAEAVARAMASGGGGFTAGPAWGKDGQASERASECAKELVPEERSITGTSEKIETE